MCSNVCVVMCAYLLERMRRGTELMVRGDEVSMIVYCECCGCACMRCALSVRAAEPDRGRLGGVGVALLPIT